MRSALAGKTVAVIGGSAGIGLAVARNALAEGAQVVIGSHNEKRLTEAAATLGSGTRAFLIDVTVENSVSAFFDCCGPFDHMAYTAGDWVRRDATLGKKFVLSEAQAAFEIRMWGMLRTIDKALPYLAENGSLVLTGGLLAHRPMPGQAISSAITGAVEHLVKGLAIDLAPRRVNIVVTGLIATEVWSQMPDEALKNMVGDQPLRRAGDLAEAAEAYLSFMRSTYTTGQSMIVDGGMSLV